MSLFVDDDLDAYGYELFYCRATTVPSSSSEPSGASQVPMTDVPYNNNDELTSVECGSQTDGNGSNKYIIINDVPWCRAIKIPRD